MCFWSRWRYVEMKRKLDYFYIFSFLIKVWLPSTSAISYTINLLELWFPLISKINQFLSFHIPILHLFNYRIVLQNFNIYYFRVAHLFRMLCCVVCFLFSSCVLCTQCCQCLWIVHSWLTLVTGIACSCDVFIYSDKTDRHNIHVTEILLKVALKHHNHNPNHIFALSSLVSILYSVMLFYLSTLLLCWLVLVLGIYCLIRIVYLIKAL